MKRFLPILILVLAIIYLIGSMRSESKSDYDLNGFGHIPVLHNGRLKPIDSVARNALLMLSGKQYMRYDEKKINAIDWLLSVVSNPALADQYPVFLVDNLEVKSALMLGETKVKRFSFDQLKEHIDFIVQQANLANTYAPQTRSAYQKSIVLLNKRLTIYYKLKNSIFIKAQDMNYQETLQRDMDWVKKGYGAYEIHSLGTTIDIESSSDLKHLGIVMQKNEFLNSLALMSILPAEEVSLKRNAMHAWSTAGAGMIAYLNTQQFHPSLMLYAKLLDAALVEPHQFNKIVSDILGAKQTYSPHLLLKTKYEALFNQFKPFYRSCVLYLCVFLLVMLGLLRNSSTLCRSAFLLLILAFGLHSLGLLSRIWLQGRPPVTNLYSSAVFVGWISIILGIALECYHKNKIGIIVSSIIGFMTLIIAHHLSLRGDTLEMMQAVLDSNFWLATHVVTVTMGYGATFLAGTLGAICLLRGVLTKTLRPTDLQEMQRMVYAIVCFALLFSFVGTVLGGIWADQSWGRFWGWDPKENGALLIVLWNVTVLHCLKANLIKARGLMLMAIFGNIITSFSWFGVNMLGVGLHSYGFMDEAFIWLVLFTVSQLILMGLGLIPTKFWRSSALGLAVVIALLYSVPALAETGKDNLALIVEGKRQFAKTCAVCHQIDGHGRSGLYPSINNRDFLKERDNAFLRKTIMEGRQGTAMVSFKRLGESKINALIAYIRSWELAYNELDEDFKGDKINGSEIFNQYCYDCHQNQDLNEFMAQTPDGQVMPMLDRFHGDSSTKNYAGAQIWSSLTPQEVIDLVTYVRAQTNSTKGESNG